MVLKARKLRKKITIQQPTETKNSYGEVETTWSTYAIRWSSPEPAQGRELEINSQAFGQRTVRFRLRYDDLAGEVTTKMRVSYDSRIFDIVDVLNPNERNREVHLTTIERNV